MIHFITYKRKFRFWGILLGTFILIALFQSCNKEFQESILSKRCVASIRIDTSICKTALIWSAQPDDTLQSNQLISYNGLWRGKEGMLKTLVQFDLSVIPADATIDSVFITFFNDPVSSIQRMNNAELKQIISPWDKDKVTWNSAPQVSNDGMVSIQQQSNASERRVNCTNMFQFWLKNPKLNYGMMLTISPEIYNNAIVFASERCSNQVLRPKINIYYRVLANNECLCEQVPVVVTEDTIQYVLDSLIITPNPLEANDATIWENNPDEIDNKASIISIGDGASSGECRSLIKINIGNIQNLVEVTNAKLYLYNSNSEHNGDAIQILPITSTWTHSSVTWNNQPQATTVGSIQIAEDKLKQDIEIDVTEIVDAWIQYPTTNYGLMFKVVESGEKSRVFYSGESSLSGKRPMIKVYFMIRK